MTKYFWNTGICLLILGVCIVKGQKIDIGITIQPDSTDVAKYEFTGVGINQTYLQMPYGSPEILNPNAVKVLKGKRITKAELVYTIHPRPFTFETLNNQRIAALSNIAPEIFSGPAVNWAFVRQTDCYSYEEAVVMFHGFVFTYTSESSEEKKNDIDLINDIISGRIPPNDSTILRVFERNRYWKNMLVVTDFTGSMTPFTAQLLLWHKLNFKTNKAKHFVFFNDGDKLQDWEKLMGKTGGIYHVETKDFKKVLNTAYQTIRNGNGGGTDENDLEALIKGVDSCKDCDEIVLIADNRSGIRDYQLITQLNKPVKIILCGTKKGIHPVYLSLAYQTGGSIHTIEKDIYNLIEINEGETITVLGNHYILNEGKFVRIKTNKI